MIFLNFKRFLFRSFISVKLRFENLEKRNDYRFLINLIIENNSAIIGGIKLLSRSNLKSGFLNLSLKFCKVNWILSSYY